MGPKVQQKSKEAKAMAAAASGKKANRDKANMEVLFAKATYEKLLKEAPKMKLITISALVERFKLGGALARVALKHLTHKGPIRPVSVNHTQVVYTRATN